MSNCPELCEDPSLLYVCAVLLELDRKEAPSKPHPPTQISLAGRFGLITWLFIRFSSWVYSNLLHLINSPAFSEASDIARTEAFPDFSGLPSSVLKSEML